MKVSAISRRALCGLAGIAAASPRLVLAKATDPSSTSMKAQNDRLKVLDPALRLTVEVLINERGPFPFIIDTGANASMISSELADAIGLGRGAVVALHGIAGVGLADTTVVDSLRVGRRRRRNVPLIVVPEQRLGSAGLLGLDWLGTQSLMLDYRKQLMTIDVALPNTDDRTLTIPAWTKRSGITLVEATVQGMRLPAFIDSGATNTVGNLAFYEEGRRRGAIGAEFVSLELHSVTGQMLSGRLARLKTLIFGGLMLRNVPVVFGPIHTFDYWDLSEKPAILIGTDILQKFDTIAMDFKRGEIRFQYSDRG
ncbi:aspartyl protease family protein [Caulobacter sp. LARHSG274]